ncbi:MAG: NAD(P)H-hydrate dehydratase [Halothiobacillaceae bacterium]
MSILAPRLIRAPAASGLTRAWSVEAILAHEQALFAGGVDAYGLMESAGAAAFDALCERWPKAARLAVLVGSGQNGGDGLVVARLAHRAGLEVNLLGWQEPDFHGSAAQAWAALREAMPSVDVHAAPEVIFEALTSADVVVDALFGIGLSGPIGGTPASFLERVQQTLEIMPTRPGVLAVDLPSGLNADTGVVDPLTLTADVTVTFLGIKRGQVTGRALAVCGERVLAELGYPLEAEGHAPDDSLALLPGGIRLAARPQDGHKGSFGTLLVVGGNRGMPGAARLAAESALRAGAGKVIVATHPTHAATLNIGRPELIVHGAESAEDVLSLIGEASAIVIGPGLGRDDWAAEIWRALHDGSLPMVVDAEALRLLRPQSLQGRQAVITPHPGEAAGMLDCETSEINADRIAAARILSARFGCGVVLKGAGSVLADGERLAVCQRGSPALATAGSGDVLAGLLGAFFGMGMARFEAMEAAVCVHAEAGEDEAARDGEWGMAAGELCELIRARLNGRGRSIDGGWRRVFSEGGNDG